MSSDFRALSRSELEAFAACRPGRSVVTICVQWLVIAGAVAVAIAAHRWYVYAICAAVIATRQHALAVLVHDAAHGLLFRGRLLNEELADLTLGFPLFIATTPVSWSSRPSSQKPEHSARPRYRRRKGQL